MHVSVDLWQLPNDRLTCALSDKIESNFYARCPPEKRPAFLRPDDNDDLTTPVESQAASTAGDIEEISPSKLSKEEDLEAEDEKGDMKEESDSTSVGSGTRPKKTKTEKAKPKHDESLLMALHTTFMFRWWTAGVFKLLSGEHSFMCMYDRADPI